MNPTTVSRRIAVCAFVGGLGGGLVFPILPALGLRLGIPSFMIGLILAAKRISRLVFNVPAGHLIGRLGARLTLSMALLVECIGVLGYSAALHFGNAMWWLLDGRLLVGCSALVAFGIGRAIDAVPLRSTLLFPALAGLAAGFAVLAMAQTLWLTLLSAVLVGLSYNGVTLPMLALLGDAVSHRQHGPAVGIYQFFGDVGGTIGPIVGIEAGTNIGLMPLYLTLAVLPALAILVAVWLRGRERQLHAARM